MSIEDKLIKELKYIMQLVKEGRCINFNYCPDCIHNNPYECDNPAMIKRIEKLMKEYNKSKRTAKRRK